MAIVRATEAAVFEMPGFQFNGLTAPSRGAQELCTWRLHIAPGATSDPHRLDREEIFVVQGSVEVPGARVTSLETWSWRRSAAQRQPALVSGPGALLWLKRGHL